jgi:hypothetical protein
MRPFLIGLLVAGCVPEAKSNKCAYWGELSGSAGCVMSNASSDSGSNRTLMTLESSAAASDGALIKVTIALEGAPEVGERTVGTTSGLDEAGQPGCAVWLFLRDSPDGTRNEQTFGGDELVGCTLTLTEVVAIDESTFVVHGNIESGVVGGMSVRSPLRRARLAAGF